MPGRLIAAALLILLQIVLAFVSAVSLSIWFSVVYTVLEAISVGIAFYILVKKDNPSYKLTWIIFLIVAPVVGGILFFLWGNGKVKPKLRKRMAREHRENRRFLRQNLSVSEALAETNEYPSRQSRFLYRESGFPVYTDTGVEYFAPGEKFLPRMLSELRDARKYIFMEYFIIGDGKMWDSIHSVLLERVQSGVEVRIIFDDFGSVSKQNDRFVEKLRGEGIKVVAFNKIKPSIDLFLNNRDHRKICVIDGYVSMTGGINIADEYINHTHPHGYWLDSAVILKGAATTSFAVAFCEMWNCITNDRLDPSRYLVADFPAARGFVQPYTENPLDTKHHPAEGIYRQILGTAKDYVYIETPYLILDNNMISAVTSAAKAGVDVRIITPKIRDKWYVHPVTRYYYDELLEAGVRIFEFTPGFIHSKLFVSDDEVATCGTVNMDYRSFYFHFECGVWMCGNSAAADMKQSFLRAQGLSEEILLPKWRKRPVMQKIIEAVLHLFAPFM